MVGLNHPFCSNETVGATNEAAAIFVLLHIAAIEGDLRISRNVLPAWHQVALAELELPGSGENGKGQLTGERS